SLIVLKWRGVDPNGRGWRSGRYSDAMRTNARSPVESSCTNSACGNYRLYNLVLLCNEDERSEYSRPVRLHTAYVGHHPVLRAHCLLCIFCGNTRLEIVRNELVLPALSTAVRSGSKILAPRWSLRFSPIGRSVPENDVRCRHSDRAVRPFPSCPLRT